MEHFFFKLTTVEIAKPEDVDAFWTKERISVRITKSRSDDVV